MSFYQHYVILLLICIGTCYSSFDDTNELAKVCRPVALRLNVLFLLDGSGSVSGSTFAMQMEMLNKIANMMNIGKNESQIAVLQYAGFTRLEFGFNDHQNLDELLNKLHNIRHMSGTTKTGKAMFKALDLFQKAKRVDENDVSQVAVVVTDGHSHDNPLPAAEALRATGVTILTLGIGEHINRDEIVRISGKDELAFQDLHKNISLENFVAGFKNLSQGEHCEYARGSDGSQITCGPGFIQVEISTTQKLKGHLFFEGFHAEPGCSSSEESSHAVSGQISRYDVQIRAVHGKCGLVKSYEKNSRGFVVTSRAILQFDRRFATDHDHIFEIRCIYADKSKKPKTPNRTEGVITHVQDEVNARKGDEDDRDKVDVSMRCSYEVRPQIDQCSSNGITVGTELLHKWTCDQAHGKFLVHSCFIVDPVTHRSEVVINSNGCTIDKSVISDLTYHRNGTVTASGEAVRFADAPIITYSCRLRLCEEENEDCGSLFPPQCRRKRSAIEFVDEVPLSDIESFTREYDSAAYDDDVEALLPDPPSVSIRKIEGKSSMEETSSSPSVSSTFSLTPIKRMSSIVPLFPPGGVEVMLNSKTVAIVKDDHARDRFKQALQLRADSAQSISIGTADEILRSEDVPVKIHEKPNPTRTVVVTASVKKRVTKKNVIVKRVKGFVKRPSKSKNNPESLDDAVPSLPPLDESLSAVHETVGPSLQKPIETTYSLEKTRSIQTTSSFPSITTTRSHISTLSTNAPVATIEEIIESSSLENVIEEVVVTSDPLVVRLPHEKFTNGCRRSIQC